MQAEGGMPMTRAAFFLFVFLFTFCYAGESFAKYGYFIDKLEFPVKKAGKIWATPSSVFEGPFRTNDTLGIYLPPHYLDEGRTAFFRGPVETAASSIAYYNNYAPGDSQLSEVFLSGVKTGVPVIPFPQHGVLDLQKAAMGDLIKIKDDITLPHDAKNHLTGGIVVKGDLADLKFSADHKIATLVFTKDRWRTYVVEVEGDQTRLTLPNGKPIAYDGVPNGAIYIDGDLGVDNEKYGTGLHGTVRGRWTVGAKGDIFITDNLLYSDTPEGSSPQGNDVLGLIGRNVFIGREAPELLFLYATVFAGERQGKTNVGSLFVLMSNDNPHNGQMFWFGNYAGAYPAIMGRFDRSTGESTDGYDLHKFYDARLSASPPPFFPETGP